MDFLAPRGVNRFSCASGAAFKDTWQPNFCLASQAQLGQLVFTLNRQAGLTLKMNIQTLRREWRAEGERPSHQQWQTRAGSQAAPGWGQAFTQLQLGVSPGEAAFMFKAWGASVGVSMVPGLCPMNTKQQRCTAGQRQCRQ